MNKSAIQFSGELESVEKVLESLRNRYNPTNPDEASSSASTLKGTIANTTDTNTKQDMAPQTQDNGTCEDIADNTGRYSP